MDGGTAGVAAVVVTHGPHADLARCLAALAPQVDELVLVANLPGELPDLAPGIRLIVNERPTGYAANANTGIAATTAPFVVVANPDAVPGPGAVAELAGFASAHPRCGVAGPRMHWPGGRWQPSRRRFPTVAGTLLRRTPLRLLRAASRLQRDHYLLDEQPERPAPADWMLGAFLLLRREMLDELGGFDGRFRLYGEDIELCYRAAKAGWERWYVPGAVVEHRYDALIDRTFRSRRTLWHLRGMLRFVMKHPERLRVLR